MIFDDEFGDALELLAHDDMTVELDVLDHRGYFQAGVVLDIEQLRRLGKRISKHLDEVAHARSGVA